MIRLSEAVEDLQVHVVPEADPLLCGVTANSRRVVPGDLFAALPGEHVHGAKFAGAAVAAGAVAILTDAAGLKQADEAGLAETCVVMDDPAAELGLVAARIYGEPARSLRSFGVTGTNGKTTTAYIIDYLLRALKRKPALIGTVELRLAGRTVPATLTTPMPADLQRLLREHADWGGDSLVMEVSSHALAQGRTDPICFSVAGFTNLTQDHLDFHKTMENYYAAKRSLFTPARCARGVVCIDDAWGEKLVGEAQVPVVALRVSEAARGGGDAAGAANSARDTAGSGNTAGEGKAAIFAGVPLWRVSEVRPGVRTSFTLRAPGGEEASFSTNLPGSFNIQNLALALVMVAESGVELGELARATNGKIDPVVPGRMEVLSDYPRVIVDFAHNTAALENAMGALTSTTRGRLIVLTGSAGERDADKRPAMGEAVAKAADLVYITDDDPHDEDPDGIRRDLLRGTARGTARVIEIADRRQAIAQAIAQAAPDDTVLLAGRGHETKQPMRGGEVDLDDRVEARRAIAVRQEAEQGGTPRGKAEKVAEEKQGEITRD
ncbi:Mur ligase family protein [Actinobaculum massiliense]|uniref:UDP-N-acetylmuramyl-tripeptide synthetase n=1 Tax=Actinobaculum massiliense ACS-171-V-Col2 TaxID=883066 RepID=K9EJK5_9ACTO|nr:UDP-N-acetylmuramoyl-L-alanyl-D-glutamate--2,6-diaminopimelate ligase [Actinobaculum massiliense]EKU96056.1 UDP-N-acetylmuramyl-tripeptide synthetase [Actinobaculum massiliense ACS-171-V-Col2]MDK8318342.1 UDP-N-acetylmuramoyl-L-alanyl-D-glutamate--2,6-diaminopimelate ligase [Actinobaculum massiliense]MDK8566757.1 UDP-N-acetylmuramoyl-L-alanyl-D-glutamate--2,6-diaminopimelate ligase [Actinobaculum massiliense]